VYDDAKFHANMQEEFLSSHSLIDTIRSAAAVLS